MRNCLFALLIAGLAACNLQKTVDIKMPEHQSQLVVEAYLQEGQAYRLALTESQSYLSQPTLPLVNNALVVISRDGQNDTLRNQIVIIDSLRKGYNYASPRLAKADPQASYRLYIRDQKGRTVEGTTRFLPTVPIEKVEWSFKDSLAYLLVRFRDDPTQRNYYRISISKSRPERAPETDFTFTDVLFNTNAAIGTAYRFKEGDTAVVSLYHIDKAYYDFAETTQAAFDANLNPFGQPTQVRSTVQKGLGVFTTLVLDRKTVIIKK